MRSFNMVRTKIFTFSLIAFFVFLILSTFNLEVLQGKKYRELSNLNSIRLLPKEGARGRIIDRQGNILVDNKLSYDVMILPEHYNNQKNILKTVSRIIGVDEEDLRASFKKNLTSASLPVKIADDVDIKKAIALEEVKLDLAGIIIESSPKRYYPYSRLASHAIGYLGEIDHWRLRKLADYGYKRKDIVGFGGIEEKYDYYLREEDGGSSIEVDNRGRMVRILGFKPPQKGKDIESTLDLRLQKIAEEKINGRTGSVVIIDPQSGEILAMANFPDFNPALFRDKRSSAISNLFDDADAPLLNRATGGVYPPGSIFKLVVASAALETGRLDLSRRFFCTGSLMVGRKKFKCWNDHGSQNIISAIANSCNVFFYNIGLLVGPKKIYDYALKFGLSKKSSSDLPYEAGGFIPSPLWRKFYKFKKWYAGDTANMSIGQGEVLATPLQIARIMAIFANGGKLVTPYIVKAIDGRSIVRYQRKIKNLSLKKMTLDAIGEGLRRAVSDPEGTANVLSSLPIAVAGKTGTAQAPPGTAHGWFVGFFPFEEPKYVICVFLERGGHGYSSAVLAKEIIQDMIIKELI
ncbi:MAG: penicillin-binding protein 2 [Candidatus Omnitrophica bacterium]|nr:penicillin-binding protein 2 [Candidatus Omnitrophota bacterium]